MKPAKTVTLPAPAERLPFDGERFVSGLPGEIAHEHYQRYLFAMQFCTGKSVLDIASGEGYGSSLLSQVAEHVHGVDLSDEAVDFANRSYGSDKVRFSRGDLRNIPCDAATFDIVVSFESLEHIAEHERFLEEAKRVLRPDGMLILSSPNRDVYLRGQPPNPFHQREPNRQEFETLVHQFFRHSRIGLQYPLTGAVLLSEQHGDADGIATFAMDGHEVNVWTGVADATYLIAVASDQPIPAITWNVLRDANYLPRLYREHEENANRLQAQITYMVDEQGVYKSEIARLGGDKEAREADIHRLMADIRFLQEENGSLRSEVAKLNERTAQLAKVADLARVGFDDADIDLQTKLDEQRRKLMEAVLNILGGSSPSP